MSSAAAVVGVDVVGLFFNFLFVLRFLLVAHDLLSS